MAFQPSHGTIEFQIKDGVAYVMLNRPNERNTVNPDMQMDLNECWPEINHNQDVRAAIISGNGDDFCNGIDESEFSEDESMANILAAYGHKEFPDLWKSGLASITEAPAYLKFGLPDRARGRPAKPLIVAINGMCSGAGLRFVSTADIVICAEDAQFFEPRVNASLVPGEETLALTRLKSTPREIALRMAIMGDRFKVDAQRAYEVGMATEVTPKDKLLTRATEIALQIADASPAATRAVVAGFWDVFTRTPYSKALWFAQIFAQQARRIDGKEGTLAHVEGRNPEWPSRTTWSPPWTPHRINFEGRSEDVGSDVKELRRPGTPG